jgi:hypothetical protein
VIRVVFASDTKRVELPAGGYGVIAKGSHWPATDPIVLAHPEVFTDDPRYGMNYSVEPAGYDAPVEQTTAGPGEKRATRRPPVDDASEEAAELRAELTRLGRPVDSRWGLARLRSEMEKVVQ